MHWNKTRTTGIALFLSVLFSSLAAGDIVYDESAMGDFSNSRNNPTSIGTLNDGIHDVLGTIGGSSNRNNGDGYDAFSFTIDVNHVLEAIILNDYQVSGGNTNTGFNLYRTNGGFLGSVAFDQGDIGSNLLTLTGVGSLTAGSYTVSLREFTAPNQSYSLGFSVVPEPKTISGLIAGLFCMFTTRRRV